MEILEAEISVFDLDIDILRDDIQAMKQKVEHFMNEVVRHKITSRISLFIPL